MAKISSQVESLIKTLEEAKQDAIKFDYHSNSAAGVRVRKVMQTIRFEAKRIRVDIQYARKKKKEEQDA